MKQSDVARKIVKLEKEIQTLKATQSLGGEQSVVYSKYLEFNSRYVVKGTDYGFGPDYWFVFDPSGSSGGTGYEELIYSEEADPFEILQLERLEISRQGKLLSGWTESSHSGRICYVSSLGDRIRISMSDSSHYEMQTGQAYNISSVAHPIISIEFLGGDLDSLTDYPTTPFQYEIKLWAKSTNNSRLVQAS